MNDKYIEHVSPMGKLAYMAYLDGGSYTDKDLWGTHQAALINLLNVVDEGPVLEFGMGNYSTELMHVICEKQGRKLVSMDSDPVWVDKFAEFKRPWHEIYTVNNEKLLSDWYAFINRKFSVVFIDAAPASVRQPFIQMIYNRSKHILVHDTELLVLGTGPSSYGYNFTSFPIVIHYKYARPTTSLIINGNNYDERLLFDM